MNKFILSQARAKLIFLLAGVIAAVAFSSGASALPLFARQTGMVCSACHFQHFPMLNGFGRAFESAGYTMMGVSQGKVEGEGLSIPSSLNMSALATAGYEKTNQAASQTVKSTTGDGAFYLPGSGGELSLFFGGRLSENAGFLSEIGTGGSVSGTVVSGSHSSAKLPVLFPFTGIKFLDGTLAGFVPFSTDDHGASYGFELLNTGSNAALQMSPVPGLNGQHSAALSAQQYIGTAGSATGVALVANNANGFINLTKYDQVGISSAALSTLGSTYLRVAGMFELAGWDTGVGIQSWSGSSVSPTGTPAVPAVPATPGNSGVNPVIFPTPAIPAVPATYGTVASKAAAIDGQMQGSIGSLPVGFYLSYARAPAGDSNAYNMDPAAAVPGSAVTQAYGKATKSAFNFSFEVGVVPEKVTLGAGFRAGKSGVAITSSAVANASDNAVMFVASYKLAQNMMLTFTQTTSSGQYWDANHQNALGSSTSTINLFALF
ncbi:MAG: hypothetical protein WB444_11720 [Gallionella sp.]